MYKNIGINPDIFLLLRNDSVIIWDYKSHRQFLMDEKHINRLLEWVFGTVIDPTKEDKELVKKGILVDSSKYKNSKNWGWDSLSKIFHIGTKDVGIIKNEKSEEQWINEYIEFCEAIADLKPDFFPQRKGKKFQLPNPNVDILKNISFYDVLKQRKTCRHFLGEKITLESLSTLLFVSFGLFHEKWEEANRNIDIIGYRKISASGGGLHPEEIYLVNLKVEKLPMGIYHYRTSNHALTQIKQGNFEKNISSLLCGQYFAEGLSAGFFITVKFDRAWWKYKHSRAYRNVLLDIGHVSQSFLLVATSLGFQTWLTGMLHDSKIEELLGIDGIEESVIFFVGIGKGINEAFDKKFISQLLKNENN